MRHQSGELIGFIAEEVGGLGSTIVRNVAHQHRPFKATVLDANFNVVFKVNRPFYFIASDMTLYDRNDQPIGEIKMQWHLLRRKYQLYLSTPRPSAAAASDSAADPSSTALTTPAAAASDRVMTQIAAVDMPM